MTIEIPSEFKPLFEEDWREAAIWGGRHSLKSHTVARFLIIRARERKTRIACFREFQNSIAESSHQLLAELISKYELTDFDVQNNSIVNRVTGSDFIFKGLWNNEQSIKSIEGIDIAWVEEAQTVSTKSIEVLTPTVRKDKSKIIYTYNRLLEDDPVHQRLVIEGRPNTLKINVNYPIAQKYGWIPQVTLDEIADDKEKRPALYKHKWLGEPYGMERKIYNDWEVIDEIPHEARLWRRGMDFGYSVDPTVIVDIYEYNGGFIVDERTYQKGLSNKAIADKILNFENPQTLVIADSAEPKSIDEISSYGVNIIGAKKGKGSVLQGIQYVQDQKISVTKRSAKTIKAYKNYLWAVDRNEKIIQVPDDTNHEWSNPCFPAGTIVRGKAIENIGLKTGVKDVYEYDISGEKIRATPNHPVLTQRGLVSIDTIRYDDVVWIKKLLFTKALGGQDIRIHLREVIGFIIAGITRMIKASTKLICTDLFGKKPMVKHLVVMMSTTLMAILQIIGWIIFALFVGINTLVCTGLKRSVNGLKKILRILFRKHLNGQKQKKDKSLEKNLAKRMLTICTTTEKKENVIGVEQNISQKRKEEDGVTIIAKQRLFVGHVPVYNLRTLSGLYRADGLLVSNCDSIRYGFNGCAIKPSDDKDVENAVNDLLKPTRPLDEVKIQDMEYEDDVLEQMKEISLL